MVETARESAFGSDNFFVKLVFGVFPLKEAKTVSGNRGLTGLKAGILDTRRGC